MRHLAIGPLAIAALALGVVACGGGGGDELSKEELATRANEICRDFDERLAAIPQPAGAPDEQAAAAFYDQTKPVVRELLERIERLEPADAVAKDWRTFVDSQREGARLLDDLVAQVGRRDDVAQATAARVRSAIVTGSAAARRIGATSCASVPGQRQPTPGGP